ncbi:MAG: ATP-binding protein [Steroidobacteraceae bacterium]|jgi:signal transduction histidine kinase/CheY-like chemotaxis protein
MDFLAKWLRPERAWQGKHALVRVETCYRILDVVIWIVAVSAVVGLCMVFLRAPDWLSGSRWFALAAAIQIPMFASALCRGWPFRLRFAFLGADLLVVTLANGVLFGLLPNWVLIALILIILATLFFGIRAGIAAIITVLTVNGLVAWGWVTESLPLHENGEYVGAAILDYRVAAVWVRVLAVGTAGFTSIVIMLRYILGDLNRALHESRDALQRLAVEQESRIRAEQARFEAERVARDAQKFDALGRMASGVAHDFNNTLCVMKLWSGLVADDPSADLETMRAAMKDIGEATASAQQMTSRLLAFSRDEAGQRGECNLASVVRRDAETLARILPEDIVVESRLGDDATVALLPGQVQEILLNLAINARDAMPQGGKLLIQTAIETRIAAADGLAPGRYCRLSVTDTGTGISEDVKPRIFEPFFTTKAPGIGTGLGLAMIYGLVKGAGGSISVQSRLGAGSSFTILLPIIDKGEFQAESTRASISTAIRCPVLVVDKQSEMGALVERILAKEGFPTVWVRDSPAALDKIAAAAERIGLLILEGVMPEVPTKEIIAAAFRHNPSCKIIVILGHMMDSEIFDGIERGLYHKLSKPFDAETLRRVISEALAA